MKKAHLQERASESERERAREREREKRERERREREREREREGEKEVLTSGRASSGATGCTRCWTAAPSSSHCSQSARTNRNAIATTSATTEKKDSREEKDNVLGTQSASWRQGEGPHPRGPRLAAQPGPLLLLCSFLSHVCVCVLLLAACVRSFLSYVCVCVCVCVCAPSCHICVPLLVTFASCFSFF